MGRLSSLGAVQALQLASGMPSLSGADRSLDVSVHLPGDRQKRRPIEDGGEEVTLAGQATDPQALTPGCFGADRQNEGGAAQPATIRGRGVVDGVGCFDHSSSMNG